MNEAAIRQKLAELTLYVSPPSADAPANSAAGVYVPEKSTSVRERSPEELVEHLSLHLKYLVFDLEATRRENHYLRQLLENRPKSSNADGPGDPPDKI